MTKYVRVLKSPTTRGGEGWYIDTPLLADITVFEPESHMRPTGLFFADGNEVMAIDREPIGFVRFE